jgi:V/A-type H+-transporting ATPase subunit D
MEMIHPTRTALLNLRERRKAVADSIDILKARRQALMREFLRTTAPFLRERKEMSSLYHEAVSGLALSTGHEGRLFVDSVAAVSRGSLDVDIVEKSLWGLRYKEVQGGESPLRSPYERGYDFRSNTPHMEETAELFERLVEFVLNIAAFESKLKRLGEEIQKTTKRIRVLEERVEPELRLAIKRVAMYLGEREREMHYRLRIWQKREA